MWRERIDDKIKAEGIANQDYSMLFVDRGTVIIATRDFKPLNFREIVELYRIPEIDRVIQPHPSVGGWRKFIKTALTNQKSKKRKSRFQREFRINKEKQQLKKGGRGWLHRF